MKKIAFVLIGLFLAAMAVTAAVNGGVFGYLIAVGLGLWSWRCFRAVRRLAPAHAPRTPSPERRPWER